MGQRKIKFQSLTNLDTDTLTADSLLLGNRYGTASMTATLWLDDAKLGTASTAVGTNLWYASTVAKDIGHIKSETTVLPDKKSSSGACTTQGQFYWDDANDRLYMYPTSNPATAYSGDVGLAQHYGSPGALVFITGKDYITIDGLNITNPANNGLQAIASTNITVQNCTFSYHGRGISNRNHKGMEKLSNFITLSTNNKALNNTVSQIYDEGISSQSDRPRDRDGNEITGNTIIENW